MKIQFGSGAHILKEWTNVDIDKRQGADVVWDMEQYPYPFKDNSADEILCRMTLEHLKTPSKAINEFHRIIKPDGCVKIIVPHFSQPYSLVADIHVSVFTVGYFWNRLRSDRDVWGRVKRIDLWQDDNAKYWDDVKVDLYFPRGVLWIVSSPFQLVFNSCRFMQLVYEHFFTGLYRATDIVVVFKHKVVCL